LVSNAGFNISLNQEREGTAMVKTTDKPCKNERTEVKRKNNARLGSVGKHTRESG
jgi:hypothetical protein